MRVYFGSLAIAVVLFLFWTYIVWRSVTIVRQTATSLGWRHWITFAALLSVTITTGLDVFLLVHAAFTGGYQFYDPVEMFCLRLGFWCALGALIAAPWGIRKLRLSVSTLGLINLLLWLIDAMAQ